MDKLTRRTLLHSLVGGALGTLGTVVLARAALCGESTADTTRGDVQDRADRLAEGATGENAQESPVSFVNRAFRNGGGFANGGFRNGGFVNGGFRNGGFVNGGFRNGGFRNGAFRNF